MFSQAYNTAAKLAMLRRRRLSGSVRQRSSSVVGHLRDVQPTTLIRRRSSKRPTPYTRERERYRQYFEFVSKSPSDELAIVRELTVPLIKSTPVSLPFDLGQTVADNCLSLSGMGYHLGIGSYCPACTSIGEPRLGRCDRAALILAYVQQINNIYEHRAFLASIQALVDRSSDDRHNETERILRDVLEQPELFFAYHVLRDGGLRDARVLFYRDADRGGFMMYITFSGKSVHLHYKLLDRMLAACRGYRIIAHVWQTTFLLVVRREGEKTSDTDVPIVNSNDIYCKMCDLSLDGELLLEYKKLYAMFDDFPPP
ncbi:nuclear egress lamina protein [Spheniscid alphaherpesvirus 1]|uniref:Nuclear egress lamina protein n=1 Tax=Spheniscid alphaherpesvirus 1 TaxID=2560777 RepID=A0A1R3TAI4_9ALPH|nr:nuclear egress lamina protein [Spheniscid alphaherpesvirus 1]